jgi:hypothetical protein
LGYLMIYIILLSLEEQVLRFLLLFGLKKVSLVLALSVRKKTAELMKAKLPKICSFIFCVAELAKKSEFVTLFYSNSPHFSPKIKNQTLTSSKAEIPSVQTIFC